MNAVQMNLIKLQHCIYNRRATMENKKGESKIAITSLNEEKQFLLEQIEYMSDALEHYKKELLELEKQITTLSQTDAS